MEKGVTGVTYPFKNFFLRGMRLVSVISSQRVNTFFMLYRERGDVSNELIHQPISREELIYAPQ